MDSRPSCTSSGAGRVHHAQPAREAQRDRPPDDPGPRRRLPGGRGRPRRVDARRDGRRRARAHQRRRRVDGGPAEARTRHPGRAPARVVLAVGRAQEATPPYLRMTKPIVVRRQRSAAGAGLDLVTTADIAIAAEHATFFDPHVSIGLVSGRESVRLARVLPVNVTMRLALMGKQERLSAARAYELGLVTEVVPSARLRERAWDIAELVNRNAPLAVRGTRLAIRKGLGLPVYEAELLAEGQRLRVAQTDDAAEGRAPSWRSGRRSGSAVEILPAGLRSSCRLRLPPSLGLASLATRLGRPGEAARPAPGSLGSASSVGLARTAVPPLRRRRPMAPPAAPSCGPCGAWPAASGHGSGPGLEVGQRFGMAEDQKLLGPIPARGPRRLLRFDGALDPAGRRVGAVGCLGEHRACGWRTGRSTTPGPHGRCRSWPATRRGRGRRAW